MLKKEYCKISFPAGNGKASEKISSVDSTVGSPNPSSDRPISDQVVEANMYGWEKQNGVSINFVDLLHSHDFMRVEEHYGRASHIGLDGCDFFDLKS